MNGFLVMKNTIEWVDVDSAAKTISEEEQIEFIKTAKLFNRKSRKFKIKFI